MSRPLPLRANLEWLKKACKERLAAMRAANPQAKLNEAQLAIAREYGFPSWRKLKTHVEQVRDTLDSLLPSEQRPAAGANISPGDPDLARLLSAVRAGDQPGVTELLGRRPELADATGPEGETPLHVAAECNDPRLGMFLLACGANAETRYGGSGHTALSWAVTCNSLEFAGTLLRLGHKADLFCAAGIGSIEHVRGHFDDSGYLRAGAAQTGSSRYSADGKRLPTPPQDVTEQISDALYVACRNGHTEVVRFLLTKKPDLSFRAYMGGTPLHWAHFGGSREVIRLLEQAGADTTARDDGLRCTPRAFGICVPAQWGFVFLVRKRLAEDPTLAKLTDGGTSPLHEAARGGSVEVVRILLEAGADPRLRNGEGKAPLEIADERGHVDVVKLLTPASQAVQSQSPGS